LHEKILKGFYDIDEGLNTRNRERVADAAQYLTTDVLQYGALVSAHKAWAVAISGRVDFLDYPTCVPGHYFILPHCSEVRVKSFNSEQTLEGVGEGFTAIVKLSNDFRIGSAELPDIKISEDKDTGEGIFDTSLRGRLELNKELLRRAGFFV